MPTWWRLGSVLAAGLSLVVIVPSEGKAQERRPSPPRDGGGTDARMLADLEILRDLELLRQLDLLRKLEQVRTEPPPRSARTDERGKP